MALRQLSCPPALKNGVSSHIITTRCERPETPTYAYKTSLFSVSSQLSSNESSKGLPWVVAFYIFNHLIAVRSSELDVTSTTFVNRLVGSSIAIDLPTKG